jgi:hypothetical protein
MALIRSLTDIQSPVYEGYHKETHYASSFLPKSIEFTISLGNWGIWFWYVSAMHGEKIEPVKTRPRFDGLLLFLGLKPSAQAW